MKDKEKQIDLERKWGIPDQRSCLSIGDTGIQIGKHTISPFRKSYLRKGLLSIGCFLLFLWVTAVYVHFCLYVYTDL